MSDKQEKTKRRPGDRYDAVRVRGLDSMHRLMPGMQPNRSDNEAYILLSVQTEAIDAYIAKKNAENPEHKYTMYQVILAALGKTIEKRPLMNRFIMGNNYYDRTRITMSMVAKREFTETASEGVAILTYDPTDGRSSVDQMHDKLCDFTYRLRTVGESDSTTDDMDIICKMPGWLVYAFMRLLAFLDRHGHMPLGLAKVDPYNSTVFISNIGSLKLNAGYHHLSNWGTNSIFVIVGEKKPMPYYDEAGNVTMRSTVELGLTLDERIGDGYYFSKTVRLLKKLLEHPELLDRPSSEEIEIDY